MKRRGGRPATSNKRSCCWPARPAPPPRRGACGVAFVLKNRLWLALAGGGERARRTRRRAAEERPPGRTTGARARREQEGAVGKSDSVYCSHRRIAWLAAWLRGGGEGDWPGAAGGPAGGRRRSSPLGCAALAGADCCRRAACWLLGEWRWPADRGRMVTVRVCVPLTSTALTRVRRCCVVQQTAFEALRSGTHPKPSSSEKNNFRFSVDFPPSSDLLNQLPVYPHSNSCYPH